MDRKQKGLIAGMFVLFLAGSSSAEILNQCKNITQAGTYVLESDLEIHPSSINEVCFRVKAADVWIDCQGHAIYYPPGIGKPAWKWKGIAVHVLNAKRVGVRNCRFGYLSQGIAAYESDYGVYVSNSYLTRLDFTSKNSDYITLASSLFKTIQFHHSHNARVSDMRGFGNSWFKSLDSDGHAANSYVKKVKIGNSSWTLENVFFEEYEEW
ncbi:hypothetical protein DRN67_04375 [Candidatus Micrarchaeota archaeon]|nr:MAG: hypothetical protein DRN67_04375 [Candidatus Micrarchaeota archaeon]